MFHNIGIGFSSMLHSRERKTVRATGWNQGAHYRTKSGKTGNLKKKKKKKYLQGKVREFEKWGNQGKIREFCKNMSGKYQGIFNLFHEIKITMIKMSTFL